MRNQTLPREETSASHIERWMGAPLNLIEELGHFLLVMPLNAARAAGPPVIQTRGHASEGGHLTHPLPVTLIVSMWLGFKAT